MAHRFPSSALLAALVVAVGCEPDPGDDCGSGDRGMSIVSNDGDGSSIDDGSELPVTSPSGQGGLVASLDITVTGVHVDDVDGIEVVITEDGSNMVWANHVLPNFPKGCADDGSVLIPDHAVAFVDGFDDVFDVDGKTATMDVTLETADGPIEASYEILMVAGG